MEPVIMTILGGLIVSVISGIVITLLRRKFHNKDKKEKQEIMEDEELKKSLKLINDEITKVRKRIWRLEKNAIICSKIIDDQTEKYHPELTSSLEDITSELLKESD